jgi:hypothetical protein
VILLKKELNDFKDVEPVEFFNLARELDRIKKDLNSTEPSINRNIYGRIYYSIFLFLREWLKKHTSYQSWPKGEHSRMANYIRYRGPFDEKINELIYEDLVLLKKLRHQADYKLKIPIKSSQNYHRWDFTTIGSAFEIAEDIFRIFREF